MRPPASVILCASLLLACSAGPAVPDGADAGAHAFVSPTKLSDTGLYTDIAQRTLAPGVRPFTPQFELWSDGADKARFLLLPEGARIDTSDMENWRFPVGTRAWKELSHGGRPIETRLLWKLSEGDDGWFQMAYVWNAEGTEAVAAPDGVRNALGTQHDVPGQKGCESCHLGVADILIGPSALQLSRPDGNGLLSQWAAEGRLSHPPSAEFDVPGEPVVRNALGYLHGNCAHCHRDGNGLASKRKLRLEVKTTDLSPADTGAYRTTFNVKAWHPFDGSTLLVVPGDPDASQLFTRMAVRDASAVDDPFGYQMPPTCTELPDQAGLAAVRAWIAGL